MRKYIIHDINNSIITDRELEKFNFFDDAQKAAVESNRTYPHYAIRECNEIIPDNTEFPGYHYGPKFFAIIDRSLYK